jgi:hypothetical protein
MHDRSFSFELHLVVKRWELPFPVVKQLELIPATSRRLSGRLPTNQSKYMKKKPTKPPSEEYSNFERLAREIIAVPKRELDKREVAYQRKKLAEKKRKAA